jgi:hypothetical protein
MADVTEQPEQKAGDAEMVDPKKKLDTMTGLNKDGSKVNRHSVQGSDLLSPSG